MLIDYVLGQTSIVLRVKVRDSSVTTGAGLTGLTSASSGLRIAIIADNEATSTSYTVAGSTVESITTLGTYAAPTATKCRFKEVDATSHKGVYELHIADARFAVTNSKSVLISLSGATNMVETDVLVPLRSVNPYDAVRGGMTALPNVASGSAGAVITSGTGTAQLSVASGLVTLAAVTHTGATIPTVTTLTNAVASVTGSVGSVTGNVAGSVGSVTGNVGGNVVGSVATLTTLPTAPTDWITAASVSSAAVTKVQAGLATPTNITAGTITTVTTTTNLTNLPTAPTDWITALSVSSGAVTKIQTGLATPTNITAGTITTTTNLTNLPTAPTDWLTAAAVSAGAVTKVQAGLATPTNITAGTITTVGTVNTLTTYTGNTPQTGDAYARIGAPSGASLVADVATRSAPATPQTIDQTTAIPANPTAGTIGESLYITDKTFSRRGTAQAGASTTITLDSGASAVNNAYLGDLITLTGGTGSGQVATITGYVGSTKVATISRLGGTGGWSTTPDATTTFLILSRSLANVGLWLGSAPNTLQSGRVDAYAGASASSLTVNITGNLSGSVGSVTGNVGGNVVGSVATLTTLPTAPTDWLTALAVSAGAVTKIQAGLSTYAGGDTNGTTTLLTRIPGTIAANGSGFTALGDTRIANLDATVSSRSTYAGADTAGTTTLLSRVTAAVALASQIPANFTSATFASAGVFSTGALANAPTGGSAPTAAAIATAVWSDTTAGDFTTASSPGKILVAQLGGTFTSNSSTVFTAPALANAPSGTGASAASIATAVWQDLTASSDFSTTSSIGALLKTMTIPPSTSAIASAILASPANLLATDATGKVTIAATQAFNNTGQSTALPASLTGTQTFAMTGNITGNLTGSVGSVTGNVGGNVAGSVATLGTLPAPPTDWLTALAVSAGAVTKVQTGLATPTNITGGTITTVTNLTNLPTVPTDWLTAAGVKADAVTKIQAGLSTYAGTDTSGTTTLLNRVTAAVALASQIPVNFTTATFASAGVFSVGALANAPTGGSAPNVNQIAAAILATPANLLATDGTGKVGVNNLPSDYQQRAVAVTLPTTVPTGYGGTGATPAQLAAAILATPANLIATDASGRVSLDLTQAVPTFNTAQTLGDALNAARAQGFGKWVIDSIANTLTLYAGDGTTIVRVFTLQSTTNPASRI